MSIVVSGIGIYEQNSIMNSCNSCKFGVDHWTAERAIIASYGLTTVANFVHITTKVIFNLFRNSFSRKLRLFSSFSNLLIWGFMPMHPAGNSIMSALFKGIYNGDLWDNIVGSIHK